MSEKRSSERDNIQVSIRIKPEEGKSCIRLDPALKNTIIIEGTEQKYFYFDYVATEEANQEEIFEIVGRQQAINCLEGYNGCVFVYGQTGSGKTHTMIGNAKEIGLLPRVIEFLFNCIYQEQSEFPDVEYLIKCSYLEIYNEHIIDLLHPNSGNLQLREDLKKGVYVEHLSEESCTSSQDALEVLMRGASNRHISATNMNIESSRSHSVFTIQVESQRQSQQTHIINHRFSRFHFVDLAGSERQKQSQVQGDRLREGCNINRSLHILGNVINALVEDDGSKYVHYRDSKLTFLLKDSLGGNSRTHLIANIQQSTNYYQETLSTLMFSKRVKQVKNRARINEDDTGNLESLKNEIKRLKQELARNVVQKTTWESPRKGANSDEPIDGLEALLMKDQKYIKLEEILKCYLEQSTESETALYLELEAYLKGMKELKEGFAIGQQLEQQLRLIIRLQQEQILKLKNKSGQEDINYPQLHNHLLVMKTFHENLKLRERETTEIFSKAQGLILGNSDLLKNIVVTVNDSLAERRVIQESLELKFNQEYVPLQQYSESQEAFNQEIQQLNDQVVLITNTSQQYSEEIQALKCELSQKEQVNNSTNSKVNEQQEQLQDIAKQFTRVTTELDEQKQENLKLADLLEQEIQTSKLNQEQYFRILSDKNEDIKHFEQQLIQAQEHLIQQNNQNQQELSRKDQEFQLLHEQYQQELQNHLNASKQLDYQIELNKGQQSNSDQQYQELQQQHEKNTNNLAQQIIELFEQNKLLLNSLKEEQDIKLNLESNLNSYRCQITDQQHSLNDFQYQLNEAHDQINKQKTELLDQLRIQTEKFQEQSQLTNQAQSLISQQEEKIIELQEELNRVVIQHQAEETEQVKLLTRQLDKERENQKICLQNNQDLHKREICKKQQLVNDLEQQLIQAQEQHSNQIYEFQDTLCKLNEEIQLLKDQQKRDVINQQNLQEQLDNERQLNKSLKFESLKQQEQAQIDINNFKEQISELSRQNNYLVNSLKEEQSCRVHLEEYQNAQHKELLESQRINKNQQAQLIQLQEQLSHSNIQFQEMLDKQQQEIQNLIQQQDLDNQNHQDVLKQLDYQIKFNEEQQVNSFKEQQQFQQNTKLLENQIFQLQQQISNLEQHAQVYEEALLKQEESIGLLKQQLVHKEQQVSHVNDEFSESLSNKIEEIMQLKNQLSYQETQTNLAQQKLSQQQGQLEEIQIEMQNIQIEREENLQVKQLNEELENQIKKQRLTLEQHKKLNKEELANRDQTIQNLKDQLLQAQEDIIYQNQSFLENQTNQTNEIQQLKQQLSQQEQRTNESNQKIFNQQSKSEKLKQELNTLKQELQEEKSQNKSLHSQLENEIQKSQICSKQQDDLHKREISRKEVLIKDQEQQILKLQGQITSQNSEFQEALSRYIKEIQCLTEQQQLDHQKSLNIQKQLEYQIRLNEKQQSNSFRQNEQAQKETDSKLNNLKHQISELQEQNANLASQLKEEQSNKEQAFQNYNQQFKEAQEAKQKLEKKNIIVNSLEQALIQNEETLKSVHEKAKEFCKMQEREINEIKEQYLKLESEHNQILNQTQEREEENDQIREERMMAVMQIQALQEEIKGLKNTEARLRREINEVNDRFLKLNNERNQLQKSCEELSSQVTQLGGHSNPSQKIRYLNQVKLENSCLKQEKVYLSEQLQKEIEEKNKLLMKKGDAECQDKSKLTSENQRLNAEMQKLNQILNLSGIKSRYSSIKGTEGDKIIQSVQLLIQELIVQDLNQQQDCKQEVQLRNKEQEVKNIKYQAMEKDLLVMKQKMYQRENPKNQSPHHQLQADLIVLKDNRMNSGSASRVIKPKQQQFQFQ